MIVSIDVTLWHVDDENGIAVQQKVPTKPHEQCRFSAKGILQQLQLRRHPISTDPIVMVLYHRMVDPCRLQIHLYESTKKL
jgi:hypothetical protein